jgi:hypothetical protein
MASAIALSPAPINVDLNILPVTFTIPPSARLRASTAFNAAYSEI